MEAYQKPGVIPTSHGQQKRICVIFLLVAISCWMINSQMPEHCIVHVQEQQNYIGRTYKNNNTTNNSSTTEPQQNVALPPQVKLVQQDQTISNISLVEDNSEIEHEIEDDGGVEHGDEISPQNKSLPIFWINLNRSVDRRILTEQSHIDLQKQGFDITPQRIEASDILKVKKLIDDHKYIMNDVTLVDEKRKLGQRIFLFSEAACSLSHLRAIREAYMANYDYALITEDDIHPSKEFTLQWEKYASLAPRNWTVLQFVTNNKEHLQRGLSMKDPWISWEQRHWSTGAYLINRNGMEEILDQTMLQSIRGDPTWRVREPGVLIADEALYYLAKQTYSSTYPFWFEALKVESTVRAGTDGGTHADAFAKNKFAPSDDRYLSPINEKLLVLTTLFVVSDANVTQHLAFLEEDAELLESWQSEVTWKVRVVAINEQLKALLDHAIVGLPKYVEVEILVAEKPANKYSLVKDSIPMMNKFDSVMLKDSGMRLAGFAWKTFYEGSQNSLVSAPMNQNPEYELYKNAFLRVRMGSQYISSWKKIWNKSQYLDIVPANVTWLENRFALLTARFAAWFFPQVLSEDFTKQEHGWGPERLLCNAAKEFGSTNSTHACTLMPLFVNLRGQPPQQPLSTTIQAQIVNEFFNTTKFAGWAKQEEKESS